MASAALHAGGLQAAGQSCAPARASQNGAAPMPRVASAVTCSLVLGPSTPLRHSTPPLDRSQSSSSSRTAVHKPTKRISSAALTTEGPPVPAVGTRGPPSVVEPTPVPQRSPGAAPLTSLLGAAIDAVQGVVDSVIREGTDNYFLSGNFAPVDEVPELKTGLEVTGSIPEYVKGEFVRVGANPKYKPSANYHWFDGDGMLHGVRIKDGKASYINRYVGTSKLKQEDSFGRSMFLKFGDVQGALGLVRLALDRARVPLGILDTSLGDGTGNTAMVYHANKFFTMHEGDKPYVIRLMEDGQMETLGVMDYGGQLDHALTAHPKKDPVTGELFTFGCDYQKAPYMNYRVVSPSGQIGPRVPITIDGPIMSHDFAITENYAIFMDLPLCFDAQEMIVEGSYPFVWKGDERPARFGILPRNDTSEERIRWFDRPACFIYHIANAWEEGDEVVLVGCRFDKATLVNEVDFKQPDILTMFRFNMKTGESSETFLANLKCEFPRINENLTGRKNKYTYVAVAENGGIADFIGVAKFDMSRDPSLLPTPPAKSADVAQASIQQGGCVVGYFDHGPGRIGSEPVFVPRGGAEDAEDDGCLLIMVHDNNTNLSEVVILDAKTMSPDPLAVIRLGSRVPYGFHGIFVSEDELHQQL